MGLIVARYLGLVDLSKVWWTLLVVSLTTAPALVSVLRREAPRRCLLWVALMSISLRSVAPLTDGSSAFMIDQDAIYHFQVAEIYSEHGAWMWGLETARASNFVFFPALQILSTEISAISGLPLYPVCRFLPLIVSVPLLLIVFAIYAWMLGPRVAVYGCFLFSVCYKYNWFDGYYIQESLGIFFFAMVFYCITSKVQGEKRNRPNTLVFFLGAFLLAATHFFSALLLIVTLALWVGESSAARGLFGNMPRIRAVDVLPAVVILVSWLAFVAAVPIVMGAQYAIQYSSALYRFVTNPFGAPAVLRWTGIHLTAQEALVMYLGFLVAGCVGLVAIAEAIRGLKRTVDLKQRRDMAGILSFGAIALVLGGPAVAGIFLSPPENADVPYRLITFVFFFWSPAFGAGIAFIRKRMDRSLLDRTPTPRLRIALASLLMIGLLILPVASTWLLLPSTMEGQAKLDDKEVRTIASWLRIHGEKGSTLIGDDVMTMATAALARQAELSYHTSSLKREQVNGMLYYGESLDSFTRYLLTEPRAYILVNKMYLSHKYYLITYVYEARPPPSQEDMRSSLDRLSGLPRLNSVYCSSSIVLYASFPQ